MKRRNLLFLLLILLLTSLAVLAYGRYSYRRALPQTEGAIYVEGLGEGVTIYRNDWGIPNIYAGTSADLFFAQGYVHAQDRWWQMEVQRHLARGTLHELLGSSEEVLAMDRFVRTLGWHHIAAANWQNATAHTRLILEAYTAGVNAYIQEGGKGNLAMQYALLDPTGEGYELRPWEPEDSLARLVSLAWLLDGNLGDEVQHLQLLPQLPDPLLADDLLPEMASTPAPTLLPDHQPGLLADLNPAQLPYLGQHIPPSSSAWVISGEHTVSGLPLLAASYTLSTSLPTLWYEVGLHCLERVPECLYQVTGFSVPGVPGVFTGHNDALAWALLPAGVDVQDSYLLRLNPDNPLEYEYEGGWRAFTLRQEITSLEDPDDSEKPLTWEVRESLWGPVISAADESWALSVQWMASRQPQDPLDALLGMNAASTSAEFQAALRRWGWSVQHVLYAGVDGSIGYQLVGAVPQRALQHSGLSPVAGWDARYQWGESYPFEALPHAENPAGGRLIVAGQQLVGASPQAASTAPFFNLWQREQRAERIAELLARSDLHNVDSFSPIVGDDYSPSNAQLLPLLLEFELPPASEAEEGENPDALLTLAGLQGALRLWDGHSDLDSPHAALWNRFMAELMLRVFDDEFNSPPLDPWRKRRALALLPADSPWWDDRRSEDQVEDRQATLLAAFSAAVEANRDALGDDFAEWRWGALQQSQLVSVPLGLEAYGELVNGGSVETDGDFDAINATLWQPNTEGEIELLAAPSFRYIVDLGDLNSTRGVLATGQSGHPASPNYTDMADLWRAGEYHSLFWEAEHITEHATGLLRLRPRPPSLED